ncbi:hypothetical protein [Thermodesulforhabdus norvegica]|uniref:Rubrerythrin n=1 Tax=Thermodesulforhabdus norvegica TaxID=39841 RepID=A0A1I4VT66_9BACT|nr:hypothetical protein [Thermodesulforhabdus norvegica]SFN04481.1 hypothetical protein SAMN05660836_02461 [Thermodesulforhabdus norvegica]
MTRTDSRIRDFLCDFVDLKKRKAELYAKAAQECEDQVGREAFDLLKGEEQSALERLQRLESILVAENRLDPSCAYNPERVSIAEKLISKAKEQLSAGEACTKHIEALDLGIELERQAVAMLEKFLKVAESREEEEILSRFLEEDREHLRALEDLKFYYSNPEAWFMEKGRTGLDGA